MTDTEREALCKRIDELCQENEQLRAANAAFTGRSIQAGDKMACLEVENAKLQELVQEMFEDCIDECDKWRYADRMRELGIEVDEC